MQSSRPECRVAELGSLGKPDMAFGGLKVYAETMRAFTAVIEKCPEPGLFVGFVPGFPGAHSQGDTRDERHSNLREVITMLIEGHGFLLIRQRGSHCQF